MVNQNDESEGHKFSTSHLVQTTEEVAKAFIAAASAATVQSTRPSVVYSSGEESGSPMRKLQQQFSKIMKGFSNSPEVSGTYNPEILTTHKRQWSRFQLKSLGNQCIKEPSHIFESIVIVGLPPQADIHELENIALGRNDDDAKKSRNIFSNNQHQVHAVSNLEPQVLFTYPPERPLPLKYKDIVSFCLPGGAQVNAVERTPSFSELNEILLGQEQLKESNQSFVFRLQVADDPTLYGCCVLVEEIVQRPSKLVSMLANEKPVFPRRSRYVVTTPRCYCILSRLPFFDLHFGVLQSILMEERLEWLTDGVSMLNSLSPDENFEDDNNCEGTEIVGQKLYFDGTIVEISSEQNMNVSPKQLSDTDSSSGCRENQLDFISQEGQQESGFPVKEEQNNLETGTATQCDSAEEPENCVLEDTTTDIPGVKTHEPDCILVVPNEFNAEKNWDFSHENTYDGELDNFVNDTILPLIRSRLSEGSESPPRYGYDT
uniref:Uncharacterized protein n=1 Tax=Avena sativa TaxID=4498 RepID=A0ACD5YV21_AVESA